MGFYCKTTERPKTGTPTEDKTLVQKGIRRKKPFFDTENWWRWLLNFKGCCALSHFLLSTHLSRDEKKLFSQKIVCGKVCAQNRFCNLHRIYSKFFTNNRTVFFSTFYSNMIKENVVPSSDWKNVENSLETHWKIACKFIKSIVNWCKALANWIVWYFSSFSFL